MPQFVTYDRLRSLRTSVSESAVLVKASRSLVGKTVLLSHSSRDNEFLPEIVTILESNGGGVYVDIADERLPERSIRETADTLKNAINTCRRFVLFVTKNSKDSIWIPWELGLADGEKGSLPVALFPSAATYDDQAWS